MSITTNTPGQQQYTLLCLDNETGQSYICSYKNSAILTTDHAALCSYAKPLVIRAGMNLTYSIAMVTNLGHQNLEAS